MGANYPSSEEIIEKNRVDYTKELTNEQHKVISYQQSKSLCQVKGEGVTSSGFLCKIPNPVLITCNHVIDEAQLKPGKEININFTDENGIKYYKKIKLMKQELFIQLQILIMKK